MSRKCRYAALFYAVTLVAIVLTAPAYGYMDPNSWSMLWQVLAAGVVGGLYAVGLYWRRLRGFFEGLFGRRKDGADEDD